MNKEEKQQPRIIRITECLSEPCALYYTDTISQSTLIICQNPKHNKGVEKVGGEIASPNLNQSTSRVDAITSRRSPR